MPTTVFFFDLWIESTAQEALADVPLIATFENLAYFEVKF